MKTYDYMLTVLLLRQFMSRDALESMFRTSINFARHLAKAKEKNHIDSYKMKGADSEGLTLYDANNKYRRTTLVYSLSAEGLKYLISSNANLLVSKISLEDSADAVVHPIVRSKKDFIEAAIKTNDVATLATIAGATPLLLEYAGRYDWSKEEKLGRKTYEDIVRDALERMSDEETKEFESDMKATGLSMFSSIETKQGTVGDPYEKCVKRNTFTKFISSYEAKQNAVANHANEHKTTRKKEKGQNATRDFSRSGISSVIQGSFKSIVTYTVLRPGISWLKYYVKVDEDIQYIQDALDTTEKQKNKYDENACAALIVRSAHHFGMLYRDDSDMRNKRVQENTRNKSRERKKHNIGDYFEMVKHMYVIPMNYTGAVFLKGELLNRDDAESDKKFIKNMLDENRIKSDYTYTEVPGIDGAQPPFPIKATGKDGRCTYIAYGCMLDIQKIKSWEATISASPENYTIVCYDWQVEYYREIFGNRIICMVVDEQWVEYSL